MAFNPSNYNNHYVLTVDSSKIDEDLITFPISIVLSSGTGITGFNATNFFTELTASGTDSYTKLLLSSATDSSSSGHSVSLNGDTTVDTTFLLPNFENSFYFDGSGDYISIPDSTDWDFGVGDFTVECWVRVFDQNRNYIVSYAKDATDANSCWLLYANSAGDVGFLLFQGTGTYYMAGFDNPLPINKWAHLACIRHGNALTFYINGIAQPSTDNVSGMTINTTGDYLHIGTRSTDTHVDDLYGYVSEVRISKGIARWTDNFSPPKYPYLSSGYNRKNIAVTTTVSGVETELYTEIESWDYLNKKACLWTKVPALVSGTDTVLILYYDVTASGSLYVGDTGEAAAQNVWSNAYSLVYHMAQDPSPGTDCILDSTANAFSGTSYGSMTGEDLVDGLIGKALSFDGNDYIEKLDISSSEFNPTDLTMEVLFKPTIDSVTRILLDLGNYNAHSSAAVDDFFELYLQSDSTIRLRSYNYISPSYDDYWTSTSTVQTNKWSNIVITHTSGQDAQFYLNGDAITTNFTGTGNKGRQIQTTSDFFRVGGNHKYTPDGFFTGEIAEVRLSKVLRTTAWIKASYYNEKNNFITYSTPPTFYYAFKGYFKNYNDTPVISGTIRAHDRVSGTLINSTITTSSGTFYMTVPNNNTYYLIALDPTVSGGNNALIYDYLVPYEDVI